MTPAVARLVEVARDTADRLPQPFAAARHLLRAAIAAVESEGGQPQAMIRLAWEPFLERMHGGIVMCNCGSTLHTRQALRQHWQDGHFDMAPDRPAAQPEMEPCGWVCSEHGHFTTHPEHFPDCGPIQVFRRKGEP